MFTGFDFGKSLLRQVEAFKRLPPSQQPRKEAAVIHQLETYTKKFMTVLSNPGTTANPGLLKNGAEALLEAALALHESRISYTAFADMVERSRKVPVVPGLAGLIDRLLELPTDLKAERIRLLNWRITTGSLRPERYLSYMSERAKLTNDTADWKDYAYALGQLLKKGSLKLEDDAAFSAIEDLVANKNNLGDRVPGLLVMHAEALIERKNYRPAEQALIALAAEYKNLPENYVQVVMLLLDARPESSWELHQAALSTLVPAYISGKATWSQLLQRTERAHGYTHQLVDFLMNSKQMPSDEKLCTLTADRIMLLDAPLPMEYLERWRILLAQAGIAPPASALEAIEQRKQGLPSTILSAEALAALEAVPVMAAEAAVEAHEAGAEDEASAAEAGAQHALEAGLEAQGEPAEVEAEAETTLELEELEPAADSEELELEAEVEAGLEDEVEEEPQPAIAVEDAVAAADPALAIVESDNAAESDADSGLDEDYLAELHALEEQPEVAAETGAAEEPEPEAVEAEAAEADSVEAESGAAAAGELELAGIDSREELRERLSAWAVGTVLDDAGLAGLNARLHAEHIPRWVCAEGKLWLAEWLAQAGAQNTALEQLDGVEAGDPEVAREYRARIAKLAEGAELPPAAVAALGRLGLSLDDYGGALAAALELPPDSPARAALLRNLEERLLEISDPSPQLLMSLAQSRRAALHDSQAGFDVATTASLIALDDPAIQQMYHGWAAAIPQDLLHRQRARQAAYLCTRQQRLELLPVALREIEALGVPPPDEHDPELLEWLEQLRTELDKLAPEQQSQLRLLWTKLYLTHMMHAGQRERIPDLLASAAEQIEPEAALTLVNELATEIPLEMRLAIECESYLRQGAWERALDVALAPESTGVAVMPLERICQRLPETALLPAGLRLSHVLSERGDDAGRLDVVRYLGDRIGGNGGEGPALELRGFLDQVLSDLCARKFEPAVRYRLELGGGSDPLQAAHDLLALARQGDSEAFGQLFKLFNKLIELRAPADLLFDVADELSRANPESALSILTQTGLATGDAVRALYRIDELGLDAETADAAVKLGQLAEAGQDHPRMLLLAQQLAGMAEHGSALGLVDAVLAAEPDSDLAQIELIKLQLDGSTRDFKLATSNLLRLAQLYQERGIRPRQALEPLKPAIEAACNTHAVDQEAQHLKLTMLALAGELDRAAQQVQQIMLRGPQAADGLLSLFERLSMEDAELPSPMLIAWGRALFRAGRVDDALSRLAGLRDAVGDYPEYAELLEEIKAAGGGPGACMQLGETYLRVHLWQRSAEEYAAALAQDPALAEPVLTQLRHHAALDPNPMKYPLHLLGLRAVAGSSRQMDWGWALSAMTWLVSRWSAEELYSLAQALWEQHHRGELDQQQRTDLLLHLFKLAAKLGQAQQGLAYISYAWESYETPPPDLLAALALVDETALPDDAELTLMLRKYRTQAAMLATDPGAVVQAALKLAAVGEDGRVLALIKLEEFQRGLDDPLPVLLARLRLLDLADSRERDAFVHELLTAAGGGLPREQVHSLISTVLELIHENVESAELAQLLMLLFRQLGDQSRAWQLALCFILGEKPPVPTAMETLRTIAADEFAVKQRIALVGAYLVRGEHELAAGALEQLSWSNLGDNAAAAEELAEALLHTASAPAARRWLIGTLRDAGNATLAADHLLWAHAQGHPQPAEWLNDQRNGELLYRSAVLQELQDNPEGARRSYGKSREAACADPYIAASVRWRLAGLAEASGDFEEARVLCEEVLQLLPGYAPALAQITVLARAIAQRQIVAARDAEDDSPARTVRIVALLREIGDLNEAINELQSALGRGHNVPEVYIELAECFTDSGDFPIARRAYHEVLKQLEHGGAVELKLRALYGLATAEEHLGDQGEAARCLEELLLIRRDYRDGKQRLQQVQERLKPTARKQSAGQAGQLVDEILSLLGLPEDNAHKGRDNQ